MKKKKCTFVLTDLPDDTLAVILGKVGENSSLDYLSSIVTCKTFNRVSKHPDALKNLKLDDLYPPPWNKIPENANLLYQCAKFGNVQAMFLCGLIEFYYLKSTIAGYSLLNQAAEATHPPAMYLLGMILINQGEVSEGSKLLKKLWKKEGFQVVRNCQSNCGPVILELSVRQYREYDFVLAQTDIGDNCVVGEMDDVCESCFVYKEIFRFMDFLNYV